MSSNISGLSNLLNILENPAPILGAIVCKSLNINLFYLADYTETYEPADALNPPPWNEFELCIILER